MLRLSEWNTQRHSQKKKLELLQAHECDAHNVFSVCFVNTLSKCFWVDYQRERGRETAKRLLSTGLVSLIAFKEGSSCWCLMGVLQGRRHTMCILENEMDSLLRPQQLILPWPRVRWIHALSNTPPVLQTKSLAYTVRHALSIIKNKL